MAFASKVDTPSRVILRLRIRLVTKGSDVVGVDDEGDDSVGLVDPASAEVVAVGDFGAGVVGVEGIGDSLGDED